MSEHMRESNEELTKAIGLLELQHSINQRANAGTYQSAKEARVFAQVKVLHSTMYTNVEVTCVRSTHDGIKLVLSPNDTSTIYGIYALTKEQVKQLGDLRPQEYVAPEFTK